MTLPPPQGAFTAIAFTATMSTPPYPISQREELICVKVFALWRLWPMEWNRFGMPPFRVEGQIPRSPLCLFRVRKR